MRKLAIPIAAAAIIIGCSSTKPPMAEEMASSAVETTTTLVSTTLGITGMHWAGCSAQVASALKEAEGVTSAAVQLEAGTATIEYDPSVVSAEDLLGVVSGISHMHGDAAGYTAKVAD